MCLKFLEGLWVRPVEACYLLNMYITWTGGICLMCPHEPEGDCGHINQIMTAHVTCVTGPVTINHVSAIN